MPTVHIERVPEAELEIQYAPPVARESPQPQAAWRPPPPPMPPRQSAGLRVGYGIESGDATWRPSVPSTRMHGAQAQSSTPIIRPIATFGTDGDVDQPESFSVRPPPAAEPPALTARMPLRPPSESTEQRRAGLTPLGLPGEKGWVEPPQSTEVLGRIPSLTGTGGEGNGGGPRAPGTPPSTPPWAGRAPGTPPSVPQSHPISGQPPPQMQMPMVHESKCEATWEPQELICPHCREKIWTKISYEMGSGSHALCICGCCFGLGVMSWLGLLPCCIKSCQDANHRCPKCEAELGTKVFLC